MGVCEASVAQSEACESSFLAALTLHRYDEISKESGYL